MPSTHKSTAQKTTITKIVTHTHTHKHTRICVHTRTHVHCGPQKHAILFFTVTPVFVNELLHFLYQWKQERKLYNVVNSPSYLVHKNNAVKLYMEIC